MVNGHESHLSMSGCLCFVTIVAYWDMTCATVNATLSYQSVVLRLNTSMGNG